MDYRILKRLAFIGGSVLLLALSVLSGFAWDVVYGTAGRMFGTISTGHRFYDGVVSLEETIVQADVIALVSLKSVGRGADVSKPYFADEARYSKTLEFTFEVQEYLKGTGEDEIVGLVVDSTYRFNTRLGAEIMGRKIDPDRNTYWDDRDAVVLLQNDAKDPSVNRGKGRFYLGYVEWGGNYDVANMYYRPWLPEAKTGASAERQFLLEQDLSNSSPDTIAYDDLKILVSQINRELEGQSDEYKQCVLFKYRWEREVLHLKEELEGEYHYIRSDANVGSWLPQGTKVYTSRFAGHQVLLTAEAEAEGRFQKAKYLLAGRDAQYFTSDWPGYVFLARPLPAGEYRVYHAYLPFGALICGGTIPEDEMGRQELFVNVSSPKGTLHEAFFDPIQVGEDLAASRTKGVLRPSEFTNVNGAEATIYRISWEPGTGGTVKLTFTPRDSLAGHTVDFIALDGSVALSLDAADATVETNGLSWALKKQPWQSGDKLMLRIH